MNDLPYMLVRGDARRIPLADGCVQCIVTSPPYFGLRDYGTASWECGDPTCDHQASRNDRSEWPRGGQTGSLDYVRAQDKGQAGFREICGKCGAIRIDKQIGLEPTPDDFVTALVGVFRECWRVLANDGTCWVNLGDSYNHETKWGGSSSNKNELKQGYARPQERRRLGGKSKDRLGIPHRVVFALQADGWYWRDEIVWHKPNPMPESVRDRTTKAHEMVFLLAKNERYFYDAGAIQEAYLSPKRDDLPPRPEKALGPNFRAGHSQWETGLKDVRLNSGRNSRSVWSIPSQPYAEAHFATFPPKLAERCIKAGSRSGDVVFDPFSGAGTTAMVACLLGRKGIGTDLNADYLAMAARRIAESQRPVSRLDPVAVAPLAGQLELF